MSGSFRFTNSEVLLDNKLEKTSFCFENGIITDYGQIEINLDGFWVLPGIIDLHGDGFERHLAPRRQPHLISNWDFEVRMESHPAMV